MTTRLPQSTTGSGFSDLDLGSRLEDLRRALEQTIRSYEPRLTNVGCRRCGRAKVR
jgi:predicted component of type VI protein secretion system